jgi:hypothetical protein
MHYYILFERHAVQIMDVINTGQYQVTQLYSKSAKVEKGSLVVDS